MQNKIREFLSIQKLDKEVFKKYKYDIQCYNLRNIRTISFVGMVMAIMLVILCLPPLHVLHLIEGYSAIAVLFIFIFLFSVFFLGKHLEAVLPFYYILIVVSLLVSCVLGTYYEPMMPATSFVMFVIVLPLFIIDKPIRVNIVVGIMCIVFLTCVQIFKSQEAIALDIGNCIVFYLIGMAASRQSITSKVSDIIVKENLVSKVDIDVLTHLYNRGALERKAILTLCDENITASVIVMDMDNFKFINDTYGHDIGDEALVKVGDLLKSIFRSEDVICRFGGDEFIVFLPGIEEQKLLELKAVTILKELEKLRLSVDDNYRFSMCIGISTYPKDGHDYEALFKAADDAMFNVKKIGKGGYRFYRIQENYEKKSIIVADDIEMNRMILYESLTQDYNILLATNGREVLDLLRKDETVVMVITDIVMPVMDGFELIKAIKAEQKHKHKAIIAYTSYEDGEQEQKLYDLGVDDYIHKAAASSEMKLRVKNVLKAKGL